MGLTDSLESTALPFTSFLGLEGGRVPAAPAALAVHVRYAVVVARVVVPHLAGASTLFKER